MNLDPGPMEPSELLAARETMGLTQAQLAERLDLHHLSISRMERGAASIRRTVALAVRYIGLVEGLKKETDDE